MPDVGEVSSQGAQATRAETATPAPLTLGQKLSVLNDNEKFLGASYSDQTAIRQLVLGKLPEFQALDADTQGKLMATVAKAPPAYRDKSFLAEQKRLEADGSASAALREAVAYSKSVTGQATNWLTVANSKLPLPWIKPLGNLQTKVLQGDPDAAKLADYLGMKQGVALPEGIRNTVNNTLLKYVPLVNLAGSPDLVAALGDFIGTTADIAGPSLATGGAANLGKLGVVAEKVIGGRLAAAGAKGMLPAVATVGAKVAADFASGAAFGTARAALVDPQSISDAQGITGVALGWGVGGAAIGAFEGGLQIKNALTRARALGETVSGRYPRLLKENATTRAEEMYATRQLKSSDPDFAAAPEGVKDSVLAREGIEASKAKLGPQALQIDPVARLQAQLKVGPLGNRGLDVNMVANGDGTFRLREVPDVGGQIATVQNPQRGAQPRPLDAVTLAEASKEGARRYDVAMVQADARVAAEVKNVAAKKDLVDRLSPRRGVLPLQEPPRSAEASPAYTAVYKAMLEAKRSLASALFDRKGLGEFASRPGSQENTDLAVIRSSIHGLQDTLSAGAEGVVPMANRAAISPGEQQMLEGTQGVKTVAFTQALSGEQLKTIGQRGVFLDTDNPLRVRPGAQGETNALGVYSHPMPEDMFTKLQVAAALTKQKLNLPVDALDLAHTYALQAGADAVEHSDGSVTLLYPREQAKHVSDFMDPKTGRYYLPNFTKKGTVDAEGVDVRAVNKLAGDVRINQIVKQQFPNIAEPKVMEQFLAQKTVGELQAQDIELLTKTAFAELNLPSDRVRVARVEREPGDLSVSLHYNAGTTTVAVPKNVDGVLEQQAFLKNYSNALNEANKEYHGGIEAQRKFAQAEKRADTAFAIRDPDTGRIVARGPAPELTPESKAVLLQRMKRVIKSEMMVSRPEGVGNPSANAVAINVFKAPTPGADAKLQLSWLLDASKKVPGTGITPVGGSTLAEGTFQLSLPNHDAFIGTLPEVVDEFLVQNTSAGALRHDLALKGYDLKTGGGQFWVEDRNGKLLGGQRFDDHVTLMKTLGLRTDKIDGRFGPDSIEVLGEGAQFTYQGGSVSASLQKAYQFAAKFADMSAHDVQQVVLRQKEGTVSKSKVSSQYIVDMKELGVHKTFKSAKSAFKYLRGEVYDIHNLILDAENKGFAFYREDGNYVVSGPEGRHVVATREQARKVIGSVPDPEWAPNLLGPYDTPVLDSALAPGRSPVPASPLLNPVRRWATFAKEVVANYLQPAPSRIKALADRYKLPEVNKTFSDLRTNVKQFEHQAMLVSNVTANVLHGLDENESARFMEYMEANRADVQTRILKDLYGPDTSSLAAKTFVAKTERMRDVLGRTPTTGVFANMGLESGKFEVSWMPRLQKKLAGDPAWINKYAEMDNGAQAMMRDLYGQNTPKNIDFVSRYMRVSDFVDLARDTNSGRALSNYYRQGLFWYHAGPALEKFYNLTHADGVPTVLQQRAEHYIRVTIAGVKNDLTSINRAVARELGVMSKDAGDAANWILNAGTAGIFLWKPWSAMRQVFDAYAAAAPILGGNKFLDEGFDTSLRSVKAEYQKGIDIRVLSERLPTSEPTNRSGRFFSWYFTYAHQLVQGGDVVPRMAIYEAGIKQFELGMKLMKENPALSIEDTLYSWPYLLNPEQVKAAWASGDFKGAAHFFADNLQEQTSGSFRPQDQGMFRNSFGFLGRAGGQLMTMPMQMNDLRQRILRVGTPGQRALTLSIMIKNMAMIAASLNIAGIDGSSYLPWSDLTVSGGPSLNQIIQLTQAMSAPTAQARNQALKSLLGSAVQSIPFATLIKRTIRANDFMKQGDAWKAILAATATPVAKGSVAGMFSGKGYQKKP